MSENVVAVTVLHGAAGGTVRGETVHGGFEARALNQLASGVDQLLISSQARSRSGRSRGSGAGIDCIEALPFGRLVATIGQSYESCLWSTGFVIEPTSDAWPAGSRSLRGAGKASSASQPRCIRDGE